MTAATADSAALDGHARYYLYNLWDFFKYRLTAAEAEQQYREALKDDPEVVGDLAAGFQWFGVVEPDGYNGTSYGTVPCSVTPIKDERPAGG